MVFIRWTLRAQEGYELHSARYRRSGLVGDVRKCLISSVYCPRGRICAVFCRYSRLSRILFSIESTVQFSITTLVIIQSYSFGFFIRGRTVCKDKLVSGAQRYPLEGFEFEIRAAMLPRLCIHKRTYVSSRYVAAN